MPSILADRDSIYFWIHDRPFPSAGLVAKEAEEGDAGEENMKQQCVGAMALGAALIAIPVLSYAQAADIGKREYFNSCAVCHGDSGKGDGPIVAYLKTPPTDLTIIQKNNMDVFPVGRVHEVIDGRAAIAAHGPRDMPVWGDRFKGYNAEVAELALRFGTSIDSEAFAQGRILALIRYIHSLQVK